MATETGSIKRPASEFELVDAFPDHQAKRNHLDIDDQEIHDSGIISNHKERARRLSVHGTILDPLLLQMAGISVDPETKQVYEYNSSLQPLDRFGLSAYAHIPPLSAESSNEAQRFMGDRCKDATADELRNGLPIHGSSAPCPQTIPCPTARLSPREITQAGDLFMQNGFVLLHDFLGDAVCELLKESLDKLMLGVRRVDSKQIGIRAQKRYTVSDTQRSSSLLHEPGFIEALNELYEKGLSDLLRQIFQAEPRLFNAGAQVVLEGTTQYQYLHADTPHVFAPDYHLFAGMPASYEVRWADTPKPGEDSDEPAAAKVVRGGLPLRWLQKLPEAVDVNIVLEDWTWESGAPRILPGRHFYEMIRHPRVNFSEAAYPNNLKEEMLLFNSCKSHSASGNGFDEAPLASERLPDHNWWQTSSSTLRSQLFPVKRGTVIIRDVNTLHGGSPNLSARQRHMPSYIFEPREWTDMRNTMLSNRDWSWLPRFWGWPQVTPEQVKLLHPEFARDNVHVLPAEDGTEDGKSYVVGRGGGWRFLHEAFGFDEERLQHMISQRESRFHKYKRRDENYNHDMWVREDLGQKILRKRSQDV